MVLSQDLENDKQGRFFFFFRCSEELQFKLFDQKTPFLKKSEENKGEKMQMLYSYLTGIEFRQKMETIAEGFLSLRNSIDKEKMQMEKIWREREKQLEKVLLSTAGMYGSIKGIAGASIGNIPLLDDGVEDEEDPKLFN